MSTTDDGATVIILAPVGVAAVTRGSIQTLAGCGHDVWISRNAQDALDARPDTETMCMPCFEANDDEDVQYGTLPGAAFEISEAFGIPLDRVDEHIQRGIEQIKANRAARQE
jgi:hypothetical protein